MIKNFRKWRGKEQKNTDFKTNQKISLKPSDNGKTGDIGWGEDFKDMVAE